MFKINNENFDIEYAFLEAYNASDRAQRLIFDLEIGAKRKDFVFNGHEIHLDSDIRLEIGKLLVIYPNQIKKWEDIAGTTIKWHEPERDEPESDYPEEAFIYVLDDKEPDDVYDGKAEFRNVNGKLFLRIKAFVDMYVGSKWYKKLPLEIETELHFNGIAYCDWPEDICKEKTKPYLDADEYEIVENIWGASILMPGSMKEKYFDRAKHGRFD